MHPVIRKIMEDAGAPLFEHHLPFNADSANALDKITRVIKHPTALQTVLNTARDHLVVNHEYMDVSDVLALETALALLNVDVPE